MRNVAVFLVASLLLLLSSGFLANKKQSLFSTATGNAETKQSSNHSHVALEHEHEHEQPWSNTQQTKLFNMNDYDTIFFFHTRKAGGSSVRRLLGETAEKHNLTLIAKEGKLVHSWEEVKAAANSNRTLFVTNLRDPMERIISSYFFEGRRPQKERDWDGTNTSFREWVDIKIPQVFKGFRDQMWVCASDCYCKWFSGNRTHPSETLALEHLRKMDIIVNIESMHGEYMDRLLAQLNMTGLKIPERKNAGNRKDESGHVIPPEDIEYVQSLNRRDYELMEEIFGK